MYMMDKCINWLYLGRTLVFLMFLAFGGSMLADASVKDKQLAVCLKKLADKYGWQSPDEYKTITCHNSSIDTVAGLEKYKNIEVLSLYKNNIAVFDASAFRSLQKLNLGRNRLVSLSVSDLPLLREFYIFDNRLTELSLMKLPKLEKFKANANFIETFTYKMVPSLAKIYMFNNNLTHLDIYSLPALKYMDVRQNPMPDALYEDMDLVKGATILHDGNADDWN